MAARDKEIKDKDKEKIAERIAVNLTPERKRFCNLCNTELLSDLSCGKCGIYYQPDEARHELKIAGLDGREPGPREDMPIISIDTFEQKKSRKMSPFFEALEGKGFKFTSYSDTAPP